MNDIDHINRNAPSWRVAYRRVRKASRAVRRKVFKSRKHTAFDDDAFDAANRHLRWFSSDWGSL